MKQTHNRLAIATLAILTLFIPATASAHNGVMHDESDDDSMSQVATNSSPSPSSASSDKRQRFEAQLNQQLEQQKKEREQAETSLSSTQKGELRQRLDDAKKKICQNHQTQINGLMGDMDNRRQNAYNHITQVFTAVKKFYTDKKLTVSNYDDLVAAAAAAQSAASSAMQLQKSVPDINCDSDHPRADVADFKQKRADSIDAMKAYRDSVRSLVQAVKTAQGAKS